MTTQEEIYAMADEAQLSRAEALDVTFADENGNPYTEYYWQGWMGDPINAFIQVTGKDEKEAHENLGSAGWEILQNREQTQEAAETPVDETPVEPDAGE
jgi:hypothetical protein